jgi:hypothetical protein
LFFDDAEKSDTKPSQAQTHVERKEVYPAIIALATTGTSQLPSDVSPPVATTDFAKTKSSNFSPEHRQLFELISTEDNNLRHFSEFYHETIKNLIAEEKYDEVSDFFPSSCTAEFENADLNVNFKQTKKSPRHWKLQINI